MRATSISVPALMLLLTQSMTVVGNNKKNNPPSRPRPMVEIFIENKSLHTVHLLQSKSRGKVASATADADEAAPEKKHVETKAPGNKKVSSFLDALQNPPPPQTRHRYDTRYSAQSREKHVTKHSIRSGTMKGFPPVPESDDRPPLRFEIENIISYKQSSKGEISDNKPYVFSISPVRNHAVEPAGNVYLTGDFRYLQGTNSDSEDEATASSYNTGGDELFEMVRESIRRDNIKTFSQKLHTYLEREKKEKREVVGERGKALARIIYDHYHTLLLTEKQLLDIHETKTLGYSTEEGELIQRKITLRNPPLSSTGWPAPWDARDPFRKEQRLALAERDAALFDEAFENSKEIIDRTHHLMALQLHNNIRRYVDREDKTGQQYWHELTAIPFASNREVSLDKGLVYQAALHHISQPNYTPFSRESSASVGRTGMREPGLSNFISDLHAWTSDVANQLPHTCESEQSKYPKTLRAKRERHRLPLESLTISSNSLQEHERHIQKLENIAAPMASLRQHEAFLQRLVTLNDPELSRDVQAELDKQIIESAPSPELPFTRRGLALELAAKSIGGIKLHSEQEILNLQTLYHSYNRGGIEMMLREVTGQLNKGQPAAMVINNGDRILTVLQLRNGKLMVFDPHDLVNDTELFASDNYRRIAEHIRQKFVWGAQKRPHHCTTQILVNRFNYPLPLNFSELKYSLLEHFMRSTQESDQLYGAADFYLEGKDIANDDSLLTAQLLDLLQQNHTLAQSFVENTPLDGDFNLATLVATNQALLGNPEHWEDALNSLARLLLSNNRLAGLLIPPGSKARAELQQAASLSRSDPTWVQRVFNIKAGNARNTIKKRPLPPTRPEYFEQAYNHLSGKTSASNYANLLDNIATAQTRWPEVFDPKDVTNGGFCQGVSSLGGLSYLKTALQSQRSLMLPNSDITPTETHGFRKYLDGLQKLTTSYNRSTTSSVIAHIEQQRPLVKHLIMLQSPNRSPQVAARKQKPQEPVLTAHDYTLAMKMVADEMGISLGPGYDQLLKRTLYHHPENLETVLHKVAKAVPVERNCALLISNNFHMIAIMLLKDGSYLVFDPNDMSMTGDILIESNYDTVAEAIRDKMKHAEELSLRSTSRLYTTTIMVNMNGLIGKRKSKDHWADFSSLKRKLLKQLLPAAHTPLPIPHYMCSDDTYDPAKAHIYAFGNITEIMSQQRKLWQEPDVSIIDHLLAIYEEHPELADLAFDQDGFHLQDIFNFLMSYPDAMRQDSEMSVRLIYKLLTQMNARPRVALNVLGKVYQNPSTGKFTAIPAERAWLADSVLNYVPGRHPRYDEIRNIHQQLKKQIDELPLCEQLSPESQKILEEENRAYKERWSRMSQEEKQKERELFKRLEGMSQEELRHQIQKGNEEIVARRRSLRLQSKQD